MILVNAASCGSASPKTGKRPAPAHLPPGRADLRPHHLCAGQRRARRHPARHPRHGLDDLLEASIPAEHEDTSTALAVDWTDVESFSRPPHRRRPPAGWSRLMGLAPLALWLAALHTIRNERILRAWQARQAENTRRAAAGLRPKTRKRRRKTTLASLTTPP